MRQTGLLGRLPVVWWVLVVIMAVASVLSPRFLNPLNLVNIVRQAVPLGTVALGVTFAMLGGGVDLSGASIASLAAVLGAGLMAGQDSRIGLAVAAVLLSGALVGLANGLLVSKVKLPPFILTLATGITVQGVNQLISGGTAFGVLAEGFRGVLNARIGVFPVIVLLFALIFLICLVVQSRTRFGRYLYLIGGNSECSRLSGLPVEAVVTGSYVISGVLASIAGLFLLARYGVMGTSAATGYSFEALAAVVLGGTTFEGGRGGVGRTFAGVIILTVAFNLVNMLGFSYHWQLIVRGAIIVAAAVAYAGWRRNG